MQLINLTSITLFLATLATAIPPQPSAAVPELPTVIPQPPTETPSSGTYNVTYPAENGHPWPYHGMDLGIVKRDPAGVWGYYECDGEYWKPPCHWTQIFKGKSVCHNQFYGPQGSFGPDPGVTCTVYSLYDCVAESNWKPGFKYPGTKACNTNKFMSSGGYLQECPFSYLCTVDE